MVELCGCHYEFKDALLTKVTFPSQSLLSPLAIWLLYKLTPAVFTCIVLSLFETHFSLILEYSLFWKLISLLFWNTVFLHLATFFFLRFCYWLLLLYSYISVWVIVITALSLAQFYVHYSFSPWAILLTLMLLAINYNPVTYPFHTFSSLELCTQLPAKCSHLDVSPRVPTQNVLYWPHSLLPQKLLLFHSSWS